MDWLQSVTLILTNPALWWEGIYVQGGMAALIIQFLDSRLRGNDKNNVDGLRQTT
jgi:hypothetical protein